MKRPVQPVSDYQEHDYPTFQEGCVNRRGFLGTAAAGALAAGVATAGAVILPTEARAARTDKDPREKVSLYLGRQRLGGSQMSAQRIVLFTADKKLARWMKRYSNRSSITQALSPILRKVKADVLVDGKKLYRLERKLGATLVRQYRKKTGKSTNQPDLMLVVGRYWRPRLRGRIRRPYFRPRITP